MKAKAKSAVLHLSIVVVLFFWTTFSCAKQPGEHPLARSVEAIGITVSDMDCSVEFFSKVLSFEKVADVEISGREYDSLKGLLGLRMRVVRMKLGTEYIELSQFIAPPGGRPIPADSRSHDLWFQHIAIVVSDMEKAYRRLRHFGVTHVSTNPQVIPKSNVAAAGITAFKFRDPDGHNLELLYFPPGKGDARWQRTNGKLFLGIDHTAISISNTESSLKLYRDVLGLKMAGNSLNRGIEQERLDGLLGAKVQITGLRPRHAPPGIEFLEYLAPSDRRPMPRDTKTNDLWSWRIRLGVRNATVAAQRISEAGYLPLSPAVSTLPAGKLGFRKGIIILDPDGHQLLLSEN